MPSVSEKQHRFFQAVAHSPKFAAKVGVDKEVAKEFLSADMSSHRWQNDDKSKEKKR